MTYCSSIIWYSPRIKPTNQLLKLVGEIRKTYSPFDWSIFLMTYLLAIATAKLLRTVAMAAAIARATVVRLRLVAQAIAGIATSELGPCLLIFRYSGHLGHVTWTIYINFLSHFPTVIVTGKIFLVPRRILKNQRMSCYQFLAIVCLPKMVFKKSRRVTAIACVLNQW